MAEHLERLRLRRSIARAAGERLRRRPQTPKGIKYPRALPLEYARHLGTMVAEWQRLLEEQLIPALPGLIDEANADRSGLRQRTDSFRESFDELMAAIFTQLQRAYPLASERAFVADLARRIAEFHQKQVGNQFAAFFGVREIPTEAWLTPVTKENIATNLDLIKSLQDDMLARTKQVVTQGISTAQPSLQIARNLVEQVGISKRRATLIARDQSNKFFGQLTELRQRDVGVTEYTWSTAQDERVRPKHSAREGRKFSWDSPPSGGHPGQDYQCRCVAIPVVPDEWFEVVTE